MRARTTGMAFNGNESRYRIIPIAEPQQSNHQHLSRTSNLPNIPSLLNRFNGFITTAPSRLPDPLPPSTVLPFDTSSVNPCRNKTYAKPKSSKSNTKLQSVTQIYLIKEIIQGRCKPKHSANEHHNCPSFTENEWNSRDET